MGLPVAGLALLSATRKMMPVASFCSMLDLRSAILVALFLAVSLAAEFTPLDLQTICAALFPVCLIPTLTISKRPLSSDEAAPNSFPFLSSLAPRAPPIS